MSEYVENMKNCRNRKCNRRHEANRLPQPSVMHWSLGLNAVTSASTQTPKWLPFSPYQLMLLLERSSLERAPSASDSKGEAISGIGRVASEFANFSRQILRPHHCPKCKHPRRLAAIYKSAKWVLLRSSAGIPPEFRLLYHSSKVHHLCMHAHAFPHTCTNTHAYTPTNFLRTSPSLYKTTAREIYPIPPPPALKAKTLKTLKIPIKTRIIELHANYSLIKAKVYTRTSRMRTYISNG